MIHGTRPSTLRPVMASAGDLEAAADSLKEAHGLLNALDQRLADRIQQLGDLM